MFGSRESVFCKVSWISTQAHEVQTAIGFQTQQEHVGQSVVLQTVDDAGGHNLAVRLQSDAADLLAAIVAESGKDDAAIPKGLVEAAIGVEADEEQAVAGAALGPADQNLAIGLDCHRPSIGDLALDLLCHYSTRAKSGIQGAVRVEANNEHVGARMPHGHDFAVALDRHGEEKLLVRAGAGQHDAALTEGVVEGTVWIQSSDRIVPIPLADNDNLAVLLKGESVNLIMGIRGAVGVIDVYDLTVVAATASR